MGKSIAVANQKGGTGKTTTVLNLGACLVRFHKRKVLLIDLDPQGSLTVFTGLVPEHAGLHIGGVLAGKHGMEEALIEFYRPCLKLLPSHPGLDALLKTPAVRSKWTQNLETLLRQASQAFDYVLLDCPPTLGALTFETFCLVHGVLIPMQAEFMALRGVQLLLQTVEEARTRNPALTILGILPTMYDKRTLHSREVLAEIKNVLEARIPLVDTPIAKTVRFPESAVSSLPIFEYDPKNPGAAAYKKLAREIVDHD